MFSIGSLLIRNGTVITSERSFASDVRVEGERITEIGPSLSSTEGTRIVDAAGLLVLPGGIDPHVHLSRRPSLPAAACEGDDFLSGSRAALAGGVTTVGEIPSPEGNEGVMDTVGRVEAEVRTRSLVDVFVHPVLGSATHKLEQISALPARGQPSLKLFLMNPALSEHPLGMKQTVQSAADAKVTVLFHCESPTELAAARDGLLQQGKTSLRYLPESRPVIAEVRAVEQAIRLCRETGATGYIVHVSSSDALQLCAEARSAGLPIHIETRPEFLHLTAACHRGDQARLYVIVPPLRENPDREALWRGLANGMVDLVATDDAAFWSKRGKLAAADSFEELRMGISGLQLYRPLLFSEGVTTGRISVERFVEVTATAAARIFGFYPRKGTIAVGSDADLVLWDPRETRTISATDLLSRSGFSVYEGWQATGWPRMTLRRGEIVYRDGEICASPGSGILVARTAQGRPNRVEE
jgi:dihydropyrimidinase